MFGFTNKPKAKSNVMEAGHTHLRVAGYHVGELRMVGENHDIISIKVEVISDNIRNDLPPKIREALPDELSDLPITFLP